MYKDQNVLVVDDDPQILKLLRTKLNTMGIKTTSATNGDNALISLQSEVYNCIISDLYMPGKSGLQLLDDIQAKYSYIPVVIISGKNIGGSNATKANQKGAFYYLPKPFTLESLQENLRLAFRWNAVNAMNTIARRYLKLRKFDPEKNPEKLARVKIAIKRSLSETRSVKGINDFLNPKRTTETSALYLYLEEWFQQDANFQS